MSRGTDVGNAKLFAEYFGNQVMWVPEWKRWYVWDGKRWIPDNDKAAHFAILTVERMLAEAKAALEAEMAALKGKKPPKPKAGPGSRGGKLPPTPALIQYGWAKQSHTAARIAAILTLAKALPELTISSAQLDQQPWLLVCRNGTLNLKTGRLGPHQPDHLVTQYAPVDFDAAAGCPLWERFVDSCTCGDRQLAAFLQRMVGYAITGSVQEQVLGFCFGGGSNGKSTFLAQLQKLLGDYASPAARQLLFLAKNERHPTELADLYGKRLVICSEIDASNVFNEALVKDLTGGDPVKARRLFENFWTFNPTWKIFMVGQHTPRIVNTDLGIWRRMLLIPWNATAVDDSPEARGAGQLIKDRDLPRKLEAEGPGILNWVLKGCLEWQCGGLNPPPIVLEATSKYRQEEDLFGQFAKAFLIFEPEGRMSTSLLRAKYVEWCEEMGAEPLGVRRFNQRLLDYGLQKTNVRAGSTVTHGWAGIRLKSAEERSKDAWGLKG